MTETLVGTWKLVSSENFDELMKQLGVNFVTRKIGNTVKPNVIFTRNGDLWTMKTVSTFKNQAIEFKLNEPFEEETLDGRNVKSIMTIEGDKLVQTQRDKDNNIVCVITRELNDKGELKTTIKSGDVVSTRVYSKE